MEDAEEASTFDLPAYLFRASCFCFAASALNMISFGNVGFRVWGLGVEERRTTAVQLPSTPPPSTSVQLLRASHA